MKTKKSLWHIMDGHKTQIGAALLLMTAFCINRGYLLQDTADMLLGILTLWTVGSVGHAEAKKSKAKLNAKGTV